MYAYRPLYFYISATILLPIREIVSYVRRRELGNHFFYTHFTHPKAVVSHAKDVRRSKLTVNLELCTFYVIMVHSLINVKKIYIQIFPAKYFEACVDKMMFSNIL